MRHEPPQVVHANKDGCRGTRVVTENQSKGRFDTLDMSRRVMSGITVAQSPAVFS